MTIGIIGSGNVGGTLGTRWAGRGMTLFTGPEILRPTTSSNCSLRPAARPGQPVLRRPLVPATRCYAMPWKVTESVLEGLGDLTGKVLIAPPILFCPIFQAWIPAPPPRLEKSAAGRAARKW